PFLSAIPRPLSDRPDPWAHDIDGNFRGAAILVCGSAAKGHHFPGQSEATVSLIGEGETPVGVTEQRRVVGRFTSARLEVTHLRYAVMACVPSPLTSLEGTLELRFRGPWGPP
ncbi:MAG: hypothetical protein AB2A00_41080, partial [Myxococcota bacterium]